MGKRSVTQLSKISDCNVMIVVNKTEGNMGFVHEIQQWGDAAAIKWNYSSDQLSAHNQKVGHQEVRDHLYKVENTTKLKRENMWITITAAVRIVGRSNSSCGPFTKQINISNSVIGIEVIDMKTREPYIPRVLQCSRCQNSGTPATIARATASLHTIPVPICVVTVSRQEKTVTTRDLIQIIAVLTALATTEPSILVAQVVWIAEKPWN